MSAAGHDAEIAITVAVTAICVIWWILQPIPIPATSLIPLTVLPLSGVLTAAQLSAAYGHQLILLMLAGFLLSTALERNAAHRRVALGMINLVGGTSARRICAGFIAASAVLSMWISNTAAALMLLPVALAVLEKAPDRRMDVPLLLAIAYGCAIGGMGTPIGTPPNIVLMGIYEETTGTQITFTQWMRWTLPIVLVFLPVAAWWLTRHLGGVAGVSLPALGRWAPAERRVLIVFALVALGWITRREPFGGWSGFFNAPGATDAMVGLLGVLILFLVPSGREEGDRLLDWESANKIPWGILLLFAGGLAIAAAFQASGLSAIVGNALSAASDLHPLLLILSLCLVITFLTEATSNTATTTLLLPIVAAMAVAAQLDPRLVMLPVALSASCAFMLPVATPPNVVVFGSGRVPIERMAREGLAMNLFGAVIISGLLYLLL
ncbi:MAG: SLC13 family permease [Pseudomonadota bacterium]